MAFGSKDLIDAREKLGLAPNEMADLLRTPRNTYWRWEHGENRIPGIVSLAIELLLSRIDTQIVDVAPEGSAVDNADCAQHSDDGLDLDFLDDTRPASADSDDQTDEQPEEPAVQEEAAPAEKIDRSLTDAIMSGKGFDLSEDDTDYGPLPEE